MASLVCVPWSPPGPRPVPQHHLSQVSVGSLFCRDTSEPGSNPQPTYVSGVPRPPMQPPPGGAVFTRLPERGSRLGPCGQGGLPGGGRADTRPARVDGGRRRPERRNGRSQDARAEGGRRLQLWQSPTDVGSPKGTFGRPDCCSSTSRCEAEGLDRVQRQREPGRGGQLCSRPEGWGWLRWGRETGWPSCRTGQRGSAQAGERTDQGFPVSTPMCRSLCGWGWGGGHLLCSPDNL